MVLNLYVGEITLRTKGNHQLPGYAKRYLGKTGRVWIRVFPDRPFTSKPSEVKMGKGKGAPEGYCVPVKPGTILFEVDGATDEKAKEALRKAGTKMPVKTKIIDRARISI